MTVAEEASSAITPEREDVLKKLLSAVYSKSKKTGAKLTFAADVKTEAEEVKSTRIKKKYKLLITTISFRCQLPR